MFGSERLTGALLDRLTHHVHILELNGDSYRLRQSKGRRAVTAAAASAPAKALAAWPKPEANGDGDPSAD